MPKPSPFVDLFTELLQQEPHTTAELAEAAGCSIHFATAVLDRMHKPTKILPQRIYVKQWVRFTNADGTRTRPKAVWAWGAEPDAPRPKPLPALWVNRASRKRRREARQQRIAARSFKVASVFDLGKLVDPKNHKWKRAA